MAVMETTSGGYLKLLFWLKWKLMWRGYQRNTSAVIGVILTLLVFLPIAVIVAVACGFAFFTLGPQWRPPLLTAVLLGIYMFWVFVPLMGYALNESYDVTKLFTYPLSTRQIFTGAILGSILDFPVLLVLPTFVAVFIGFTKSGLSVVFIALAASLFLFHTLSLSQGLILASAGILRSRRFRDLMMLLIPLFWIGYYVASQTMTSRAFSVDWTAFLNSAPWQIVSYLPPGLAARAIAAAGEGNFAVFLTFLVALAAVTVGAVYLCSWMIQKLFAGDDVGFTSRKRAPETIPETTKTNKVERTSGRTSWLPPVVQAVADKEFKYLFRDPYFRMSLMNLGYMLVVAVFMFVRPSGRESLRAFGPGMAWGASGMVLLNELQMVCNIFGTEGAAASILFQFPASRRQIMIGKNLTFFVALSVVNVAFMLIVSGLAGSIETSPVLFGWMTLALVIFIAMGNIVSIRFPFRVVMKGWKVRQQAAGRGCAFGFMYLGLFLFACVVLVPVLAALLVPTFFVDAIWYAVGVPLAVVYAAGIYLISLRIGEPMLMDREIEMVTTVSAEE